jgi:hypothetical protein
MYLFDEIARFLKLNFQLVVLFLELLKHVLKSFELLVEFVDAESVKNYLC